MAAPLLRIDFASGVPAYRQIAGALRAVLVQGVLRPGNQLPPVRQLALDLGVHHNTVAEAYRVLAAEGWLELKRRRGAVIRPRRAPEPNAGAMEAYPRRLRELVAEMSSAGISAASIARELRLVAEGLKR